jgi:hypothetical protein
MAGASSTGVTLRASVAQLGFGATVTLQGRASADALVQLLSQPCGFTGLVQVAAKTAGHDGSFAFRLQPTLETRFQVQVASVHSGSVTVRVAPLVALSKVAVRTFLITISVGAGNFFTGEKVQLQTSSGSSHGWRTIASGLLGAASRVDQLIAVSSAKVTATVPVGAPVRALFPAAAGSPCFLPSTSPTIKG